MSFKVIKFSPQASTRAIRMRAVSEPWSDPHGPSRDLGFLRSWLEDDSSPLKIEPRRVNWGAISGLGLSLTVSAGFWIGVVVVVQRLWR